MCPIPGSGGSKTARPPAPPAKCHEMSCFVMGLEWAPTVCAGPAVVRKASQLPFRPRSRTPRGRRRVPLSRIMRARVSRRRAGARARKAVGETPTEVSWNVMKCHVLHADTACMMARTGMQRIAPDRGSGVSVRRPRLRVSAMASPPGPSSFRPPAACPDGGTPTRAFGARGRTRVSRRRGSRARSRLRAREPGKRRAQVSRQLRGCFFAPVPARTAKRLLGCHILASRPFSQGSHGVQPESRIISLHSDQIKNFNHAPLTRPPGSSPRLSRRS